MVYRYLSSYTAWGIICIFRYIIWWGSYSYAFTHCNIDIIATAYYSPVVWQQFYWQWSYSWDVLLNGYGTHWASGREVFNGMIAAPQHIPFGTMIVLDGRWTWIVHDRWWAIVQSGSMSGVRVDIRVGTGELWLMRALSFWRRTMSGCIYYKPVYESSLWFALSWLSLYRYFFEVTLGQQRLQIGRSDPRVWVLKSYLRQLWYSNISIGTTFDTALRETICNIQISQWFLATSSSLCWVAGTRTLWWIIQQLKIQKLLRSDLFISL